MVLTTDGHIFLSGITLADVPERLLVAEILVAKLCQPVVSLTVHTCRDCYGWPVVLAATFYPTLEAKQSF